MDKGSVDSGFRGPGLKDLTSSPAVVLTYWGQSLFFDGNDDFDLTGLLGGQAETSGRGGSCLKAKRSVHTSGEGEWPLRTMW